MSDIAATPPKKPRKRKPAGDSIRRIIDAAQTEFAEKGFSGARLESVAQAANVTKQLVYHYFHTKEELYSVILDEAAKGSSWLLNTEDYEALPPPEAIRLLVTRITEDFTRRPHIARMTLDQSIHRGNHIPARSQYVPNMQAVIFNTIAPILKRGAENGQFRPGVDPVTFFWMLFHVTTSCFTHGSLMSLISKMDFTTEQGIARWRQDAVDFLLRALQPTPKD